MNSSFIPSQEFLEFVELINKRQKELGKIKKESYKSFGFFDADYKVIKNEIKKDVKFIYDPEMKGMDFHRVRISAPACEREFLDPERMNETQIKGLRCCGTLCWKCHRPYDLSCSWFKKTRPVDGWCAIRNDIHGVESYAVLDCPMFIPTQKPRFKLNIPDETKKRKKKMNSKSA